MSGHLLLGVVRIYSKQVEYFFQDCNGLLIGIRKAYASTCVNLPENATHVTVKSITLPDNFQLDALDLDNDFSERVHDNHLKDLEEITLEDQIPVGKDQYIVVSFNEDLMNSSCSRDSSESRPQPMQEEYVLEISKLPSHVFRKERHIIMYLLLSQFFSLHPSECSKSWS